MLFGVLTVCSPSFFAERFADGNAFSRHRIADRVIILRNQPELIRIFLGEEDQPVPELFAVGVDGGGITAFVESDDRFPFG